LVLWIACSCPGAAESPAVSESFGGGFEVMSNRHVHPFSERRVDGIFMDTEGFTLAARTDETELWLCEKGDTLRLRNRQTGYIWGALPVEKAEGLNSTWNSYGNAIAAIECFDEQGMDKRYGMSESAVTTYTAADDGIVCHADFTQLGISFDVHLSLNGNALTLSVPEESLTEGEDGQAYRLKSVSFLPYLGAVREDAIDGYLFIPDGSGALMRFAEAKHYTATYEKKIYGRDLGIESLAVPSDLQAFRPNDYTADENQVTLPVYGVVHGAAQNGLFMVVEDGDIYASITASPAIPNNPYNRVTARFDYRQKYTKNINRKEGAGTFVPQEHRNALSPRLTIYVLNGSSAHYDGMAVLYRRLLRDMGVLTPLTGSGSVPLRLEVLGADKQRQLIGTSTRVFTTAEQASDMAALLQGAGMTNLSLVYRCYSQNNEAGSPFLRSVGSRSAFDALAERLAGQGGRLNLYLNPLTANRDQIRLRTQAAHNLTHMTIKATRPNPGVMYPETYFFRLAEAERRIGNAMGYGDYGFAVDQLPFLLYGDFTSGKEATRAQNLPVFIRLTEKIAHAGSASSGKIPLYRPNRYLWAYVSEYYDAPLANSQFLYESDAVPFLQIVLGGSVDLFGATLNTTSCSVNRLLRHIEYGIYPSFIVSACESIDLYRTAQEDFFSANFDDWMDDIGEAYRTINRPLSLVYGSVIVEHIALADGFIRVTYDNGARVYVNYTDITMTDGQVTVEAGDYSVIM
jgi:hypothetical protein